MGTSVINPLQGLINQVAATTPRDTGATRAAAARAEYARTYPGTAILADVSGSMAAPAWGGHSKCHVLRDAIRASLRGDSVLVAFSSSARVIPAATDLPEPNGSTAMHIGLRAAIAQRRGRILVVSDGEPDDEASALAAASDYLGTIDVLYIGPDSNAAAMAFLQRLARTGHGRYHGSDISRAGQPALTHTVRGLLK